MAFIDTVELFEGLPETVLWFETRADIVDVADFEDGFDYLPIVIQTGNLNQSMYNALSAQGFTGNINEKLRAYYRANGATSSNIRNAEKEFLAAQGATPGHINDMWFDLLGTLGYTGALNDRLSAFWADGGNVGPNTVPLVAAAINASPFVSVYRTDTTPWSAIAPFAGLGLASNASALAFDPVNNHLAVGFTDFIIRIYDVTTFPFTLVRSINTAQVASINHLSYTPDGLWLLQGTATGGDNGLWELANLSNFVTLAAGQVSGATKMAINTDGDLIAMAIGTGITVYDFTGGVATPLAFTGATQPRTVQSLDFHPTSNTLSVGLSNFNEALFRFYDIDLNSLIGVTAQSDRADCFGRWNHDGTRFMGWCGGPFATVFNVLYDSTTTATPALWPTISIASNTTASRTLFDNSQDGNFFAGWDNTATAQLRAYDISATPPIPYLADFDVDFATAFDMKFFPGAAS